MSFDWSKIPVDRKERDEDGAPLVYHYADAGLVHWSVPAYGLEGVAEDGWAASQRLHEALQGRLASLRETAS
jgi:hypothetical protein